MNDKKPNPPKAVDFTFSVQKTRPEEKYKGPLQYYDNYQIGKYARSKSLMKIQEKMTRRALEISQVEPPAMTLDLGVGCGFSTMALMLMGYRAVGIDLNFAFLNYYHDLNINPVLGDMTAEMFRPHAFDLLVSISAVQWLFVLGDPEKTEKNLGKFARMCNNALKINGKLVIQFYPKSDEQMHKLGHKFKELDTFHGGFIVDNPQSPKKRKIYLTLTKVAKKH